MNALHHTLGNNQPPITDLKLMAFDVDGVLTNGQLYFTASGEEIKAFCTLDGHGLKMLRDAGIIIAIISGRSSPALAHRARDLGIQHLIMGVADKHAAMESLLQQHSLTWREVGYMGDDIVDLPLLTACGFSASVVSGHTFVHQHVDYIAKQAAGFGAVREVCEHILQAQGRLKSLLQSYLIQPSHKKPK